MYLGILNIFFLKHNETLNILNAIVIGIYYITLFIFHYTCISLFFLLNIKLYKRDMYLLFYCGI